MLFSQFNVKCNKKCDNCLCLKYFKYNVTMWAKHIINIVKKSMGDLTLNQLVSIFRGLKNKEWKESGVGKKMAGKKSNSRKNIFDYRGAEFGV